LNSLLFQTGKAVLAPELAEDQASDSNKPAEKLMSGKVDEYVFLPDKGVIFSPRLDRSQFPNSGILR